MEVQGNKNQNLMQCKFLEEFLFFFQ